MFPVKRFTLRLGMLKETSTIHCSAWRCNLARPVRNQGLDDEAIRNWPFRSREVANIQEARPENGGTRDLESADRSCGDLPENARLEYGGSGRPFWRTMIEGMNRRPCTWLVAFGLLLAMQISPWWYATPDGCCYLSIARSVASGETITSLGSRQLYYSPGYPLAISPAFFVGDRPFLLLSVIQWLLGLIFVAGTYRWSCRIVPASAVLLTGLSAINAALWIYYRRTLSEMAFMAVLIWTVNALNCIDPASETRRTYWRVFLAAAGAVLVSLIRPAGVMLAAGFGTAMILAACKRRTGWLRAVVLTLSVGLPPSAVVLATIYRDRAMASSDTGRGYTYLDGLTDSTLSYQSQVLDGIRMRISDIGRLVIPGMFKTYSNPGEWFNVNVAIYLSSSMVVAFGWWRLVRHANDILALTFPFYLALYTLWPFDESVRFMVPMLPLLIICLWFAAPVSPTRRTSLFGLLLLAHLIAATAYWVFVDAPRTKAMHQQWIAIDRLVEVIETEPGQVVASGVPEGVWSMLQFALDKHVPMAGNHRALAPDVHWVLTPATAEELDGFATSLAIDGYKLLARQ